MTNEYWQKSGFTLIFVSVICGGAIGLILTLTVGKLMFLNSDNAATAAGRFLVMVSGISIGLVGYSLLNSEPGWPKRTKERIINFMKSY